MTDKILVVTDPDDSLLDGIRITLIQLSEEQSSEVSLALMNADVPDVIINYVWKTGNTVSWLVDKIAKSDLIIFNADDLSNIDLILGWVASKPQSYYFGRLRDLHLVNDRVIYSNTDVQNLLEKIVKK